MKKLLPILFFVLFGGVATAQQPVTPAPITKSAVIENIDGVSYYMHQVQPKQTLYSLSRFYEVSQEQIKEDNPAVKLRGLQTGMVIKIRVGNQQQASNHIEDSRYAQVNTPSETPAETKAELPLLVELEDVDSIKPEYVFEEFDTESVIGLAHNQTDYIREKREIREIALMLPLTADGKTAQNSASLVELYQGVLIALAEYKEQGIELNLSLYDTGKSPEVVAELINSEEFVAPDLIIGPVYDPQIEPVYEYAVAQGIDIVSPLATTTEHYGDNFYQLAPDLTYRFDKLSDLFTTDKNIIIITTDNNDSEMEAGIKAVLDTIPYKKVVWDRRASSISKIEAAFVAGKENIFIVTSGNEMGVDMILAQISSIQNKRTVRGYRAASVRVIGSSRWLRYDNMDKTLLFKLNVCFTASHYCAESPQVRRFTRRYIQTFGKMPSQYSERGYDAVRRFVEPTESLNTYDFEPLNGNSTNINWAVISYNSDFTIEVR